MTSPEIINCYHKQCFSGIGDFFRGSIYLYERCKDSGINFSLSLNNHPIGEFLKFKTDKTCDSSLITDIPIDFSKTDKKLGLNKFLVSELDKIFYVLKKMKGGEKFIFSNYHKAIELDHLIVMNSINSMDLNSDVCDWFKKNIYFSDSIEDSVGDSLIFKEFNVVHFRLGDDILFLLTVMNFILIRIIFFRS